MADWPPLKNSAFTVTFPIYDNDGDLVTAAAALDSEVSIDGGTFTDVSPGEASEIATSSGIYTLALSASEMNGDIIATITKTSTTDAKTAVNVMYTVTRQLVDLAYPTVSGRAMDITATGEVGIDLDNVNGALGSAEFDNDFLTAAKIANGAIDAATFAAGAIDAAAIATDAIDADTLASDAVTEIRSLVSGTADSGSTTTMVDAVRTEADTDYWKGCWILFTSGTISGQVRYITDFAPASDTITFAPVTTQAVSTNTYEILPAGAVNLRQWLESTPNALVAGAVDADVSAIQNDAITAAAIANAAIDAATFAAGAIDATAIATGAIDADAIATDAITAAKIATDAIGDSEMAADAFDGLLIRDMDQVEASAPVHSLTTAILKAVSRIRDNAGTLEVYRTDGSTLHSSQPVTTDAALDPIDELGVAS